MGSGAYVGPTHPQELAGLEAEGLAERLIDEWRGGVGDTGVRPGFVGESGRSRPLWAHERTGPLAGAAVPRSAGCALLVTLLGVAWSQVGIFARVLGLRTILKRGFVAERAVEGIGERKLKLKSAS